MLHKNNPRRHLRWQSQYLYEFLAVSYFILNNGDLKFGEPLLFMSCAMMGYSLITYFVRLVKLATATPEKQKTPITK